MTLNAGVAVTLRPGIYIFDKGLMKINGNATLNGTAVTLVFTSSTGTNYATATIFNGGAIVTLSGRRPQVSPRALCSLALASGCPLEQYSSSTVVHHR